MGSSCGSRTGASRVGAGVVALGEVREAAVRMVAAAAVMGSVAEVLKVETVGGAVRGARVEV